MTTAELKQHMAELKADLIKWNVGAMAVLTAIFAAIVRLADRHVEQAVEPHARPDHLGEFDVRHSDVVAARMEIALTDIRDVLLEIRDQGVRR